MSLEKTISIDQITVIENGEVYIRQATRIIDDGSELSKSYHRTCLYPGQDLTGQPANVVAICNAAWTDEVKTAYRTSLENLNR